MSDQKTNDANDAKEIAEKSQAAGIADESAAYENAIDSDDNADKEEPEAHPS